MKKMWLEKIAESAVKGSRTSPTVTNVMLGITDILIAKSAVAKGREVPLKFVILLMVNVSVVHGQKE